MKKLLDSFFDNISHPLRTRPLAVFSIVFLVFAILRLYISMQPLFVLALFSGLVLVLLNMLGKINNFITGFIFIAVVLSILMTGNFVMKTERIMNSFNNTYVRVEGRVSSVPDVSEIRTTFFVDADYIYNHKGEKTENIKIFVQLKENVLKFGDRVKFNGYLLKTDGNDAAFSKFYLAKGAPLRATNITILDIQKGRFPSNVISKLKNYTIKISNQIMSDEARMLFTAIVAGDKTNFSDEFSDNLTKSGLSHIACVSGLHVSLLGMGIYNLFKRKKNLAMLLSFVSVVFFTLFTGGAPSTIRAALMFSIYLFSKVSLRQNDSFTALSFSAMVLVFVNPYVIYDWGFILSFLSVLGIEVFSKNFASWLFFLPKPLRESIAVTSSAQLMTLPAITIMFGHISSYSVLANIIISSVFTFTLYISLIFVFVARIPCINWLIGILCTFSLDIICVVANFFSDMPYSYVGISAFDTTKLVCYYFIVVLYIFRKELSRIVFNAAVIGCIVVLCVNFYYDGVQEEKYTVGDNSYVILSEETSVLVAKDSLEHIKKDIINWGRKFDIDTIIMTNDISGEEEALFGLKKLIGTETIYIDETYTGASFSHTAKRLGLKIEEYPSETSEGELLDLLRNSTDGA